MEELQLNSLSFATMLVPFIVRPGVKFSECSGEMHRQGFGVSWRVVLVYDQA